ncbi:MAG: hypothetical protein NZ473_01520 [Candidatus Kapabacteria bacterium]|nr:hypothetical protein [Candidatus Kapabacteria bacterium]MCS7169592.1 hypothetical protein [Candidatus Kapabacteria bacterium]MDW7997806.1 hypothetical protein [Bacteroidota bacterium]MDW8225274.1 hypothetical protein [Bacteroidota bacterium]
MRTFGSYGARWWALLTVLLLCPCSTALAQQGTSFDELAQALEAHFDRALISDVRAQLPLGAPYEIWGWDAGDFSGDSYPDLALTVFIPQERQRRVRVYAFVDQDGFLLNVASMILPYIELPLEVGIAISDTTCFITQKHRSGVWSIRGYRYWLGNFMLWEERKLESSSKGSIELISNYRWLYKREVRFRPDGGVSAERQSVVVPVYHRRQRLFVGYPTDAVCSLVDYVPKGAYYWEGPQDASLRIRAVYDERFLYIALWVTDNELVTGRCDTCSADMLRVWFIRSKLDTTVSVASQPLRQQKASHTTSWELLGINLRIGDFAEQPPQVTLHSQQWQEIARSPSWRRTKAVVSRRPDGYTAKLRIPLELVLGTPDTVGVTPFRLRFAAEAVDLDNEFRPEEASVVCTSSDFVVEDLNTYAELVFLPPGQWYGESRNVLADILADELLRLGF